MQSSTTSGCFFNALWDSHLTSLLSVGAPLTRFHWIRLFFSTVSLCLRRWVNRQISMSISWKCSNWQSSNIMGKMKRRRSRMEPCNSVQYSQCLTEGVCVCVFDLINHLGRIVQDKVIELNYTDRERERERESGCVPLQQCCILCMCGVSNIAPMWLILLLGSFIPVSPSLPLSHTHTLDFILPWDNFISLCLHLCPLLSPYLHSAYNTLTHTSLNPS